MILDVVIPSYNRATLLVPLFDSLRKAKRPDDLTVRIYLVDNNSPDCTAEIVGKYQGYLPGLNYILERQQGRSCALNAGISAGSGDLVATIDDDEEVAESWFEVIAEKFRDPDLDFIGGPYYPNWGAPKPDWITRESGAIVGWVDGGSEERSYGPGFNAMLMGGNAVLRRRVFERVGLYNTQLGRTATGLLSCEDDDMFRRLMGAGVRGSYVPELVIYHYIPPERMTHKYHREWCWGRGTSMGVMSRTRPAEVAEILGVPRWEIRQALSGGVQALKGMLGWERPQVAFAGELRLWNLGGFINGRFFRSRRLP